MLTTSEGKYSQTGLVCSELRNLHEEIRFLRGLVNYHDRRKPVEDEDAAWFLRLTELYAYTESWESLVDCASLAILRGVDSRFESSFYRAWIEGLYGCHDVKGLRMLAQHLGKRAHEGLEYSGLQLIALTLSGRFSLARPLAERLERQGSARWSVNEAIGIYLCEDLTANRIRDGLRMLHSVARRRMATHFARRAFLTYCFEHEMWNGVREGIRLIAEVAPEAPEPYWISGVLAIVDGEWGAARDAFRVLLEFNPLSSDAVIYLARCEEMLGRRIVARDLLVQNHHLFAPSDYEYTLNLGMMERELWHRSREEEWRDRAMENLQAAARAAVVCGAPVASIQATLSDLRPRARGLNLRSGFWLLVADGEHQRAMIENSSSFIASAPGLRRGDIVFLAEGEPGNLLDDSDRVLLVGFLEVLSGACPDPRMGSTARLGHWSGFEGSVEILLESPLTASPDIHGCLNLSRSGDVRMFDLRESRLALAGVLEQVKRVLELRYRAETERHEVA